MKLSETCIHKPVFAAVLSLVIAVLGFIGLQRLQVRYYPKTVIPQVSIYTYFEGASADLMESQVSTKIENAVAGVDNIQYITSSSWTSGSTVTVQFRLGGNLESEAAQLRDKISAIQDLPVDAQKPIVTVGGNSPTVIGYSFIDDDKSPQDIRDYITRSISPVLRQLPGVGSVPVYGSTDYAMRVWLNAAQMAARNISVADIKTAITNNNVYFPAGAFYGPSRNYSVLSDTLLKNATDFSKIIVSGSGDNVVRLSDVATVSLGFHGLNDIPMSIGSKKGLVVMINPLQSANPVDVAKAVRDQFAAFQDKLPKGMHVKLLFDSSVFLKSAINDTLLSIGEAIVLVILVVILFLGSLRAASVPIITIPISLLGAFFIISTLGFTINVMSLLAMVLAIGLVVDDAIVMLENIHRHIEEGAKPLTAAITGSREIAFPVIVMCLTLVAVYAPVGFMQGVTSELFKEFAFTLASAVVISGFVALTLSPMMCSKVLQSKEQATSKFAHKTDEFFAALSLRYKSFLSSVLNHRPVIIICVGIIALLGYLLIHMMHSELLPKEDGGEVYISVRAPAGSSLAYTEKNAQDVIKIAKSVPEVRETVFQFGQGSMGIHCYLKSWHNRKHTAEEVSAELNPKLAKIPGVIASASVPDEASFGEQGSDVTLYFKTTSNYRDLVPAVNKMQAILNRYPGVINVNSNLKFDSQQFGLSIYRDLASSLGVSIMDIADTVHVMMGSLHLGNVQSGSKSYDVLLQMQKKDLLSFNSLKRLYVPAAAVTEPDGQSITPMIPLSSLVKLTPKVGQGTLHHFNRMRAGSVTATLAPGYTESQVISFIKKQLPQVESQNVSAAFSGKAQQYIDSAGSMGSVFILSFIFIYLVLSAQFGSFTDPFVILLAVPLSMVGALFSLWATGGTMNLYSQIGMVTLVGLISKHGILITKFINDLREEGMEFNEAILTGATIRLKPILMTTLAMIVGALPLAFATGPGSMGREQIGWTIAGGLFFGTFFSLVVVPVAYSYFCRNKKITLRHSV